MRIGSLGYGGTMSTGLGSRLVKGDCREFAKSEPSLSAIAVAPIRVGPGLSSIRRDAQGQALNIRIGEICPGLNADRLDPARRELFGTPLRPLLSPRSIRGSTGVPDARNSMKQSVTHCDLICQCLREVFHVQLVSNNPSESYLQQTTNLGVRSSNLFRCANNLAQNLIAVFRLGHHPSC
jgi:hypothetical protein